MKLPLFSHGQRRSFASRLASEIMQGFRWFPVHTAANSALSSPESCQLTLRRSAATGKGAAAAGCNRTQAML